MTAKYAQTEEWARTFADNGGVEYIPIVRVREGDTPGTRVIQYLFDLLHKFEVSVLAMRWLDKEPKISLRLFVHAENWLALEAQVPDSWFELPEGSKASE
ncbi:hypothetical protein [Streptomyces sp. CBMA29]|uniref:hypothetical protein n=1 Tax=Streptomyces sp. CBMA29 TaxID=1896314 RepID=UPI001661C1C5|nr:hypothetical protein [Streptomyces sp. CBMA29]MBD0739827.1 hypothetical protein [Streptomyces sp. CBMA29]